MISEITGRAAARTDYVKKENSIASFIRLGGRYIIRGLTKVLMKSGMRIHPKSQGYSAVEAQYIVQIPKGRTGTSKEGGHSLGSNVLA